MPDEIKCSKCTFEPNCYPSRCEKCNSKNDNFQLSEDIKDEIRLITGNVIMELHSAIKKYPLGFHSNHEALGVIREEHKELTDDIDYMINAKQFLKNNYTAMENEIFKEKYFYKATENMKAEAIQCAAMYIRFILDMSKGE